MAKKQKVNRPIRFDPDDLTLAETLEIDVNETARAALKTEIAFRQSPEFKKAKTERAKLLRKAAT